MELFYVIGFALLLFATYKHKDIVRIEWKNVGAFLGFLTFLTCFRIASFDFTDRFDLGYFNTGSIDLILDRGIWRLFMVWWEDMVYVYPIFFIFKYWKKWLAIPMVVWISFDFGFGHAYQGTTGILITSLYPYFISYRFGKKYGLGTVMVSHIIYDFVTVFTMLAYMKGLFA